jgi:hypothetical protein
MNIPKPPFNVRCIRPYAGMLNEGETYRVAIVIHSGVDYQGPCENTYVLAPDPSGTATYPYTWNADRFEIMP